MPHLMRRGFLRLGWAGMVGLVLVLAQGAAPSFAAEDKLRSPWTEPSPQKTPQETVETSVPALAARGALTVWHQVLTRADGPRSVMYPTASGFLGQAVAKHGLLIGMVMTADRLLHEWDEQSRAPRIVRNGVSRSYDPVEANDFWWAQEPR
jgi:uncharacterized protein